MNDVDKLSHDFVAQCAKIKYARSIRVLTIRQDTEFLLDTEVEVLAVLEDVLSLGGKTAKFSQSTLLLGAIPELDSMAVVGVITGLEEAFEFCVDDDEISAETFETVGSLIGFVEGKLA